MKTTATNVGAFGLLLASIYLASQSPSIGAESAMPPPRQEDNQLHVVLPKDDIPAINDPEFESVDKAERGMADEELVIGLVGEREQRAYSTWQLDRHEIVNDVFEGQPIAVTW
ncbi:MAG: DUF3179 domain-containing protein [Acidobacteria bacterium]|nr:DUF3179 domain-containing protein [Acidobacteriota bacterium]